MEGNMKILQNERAKNNDTVEHRHDASTSNICAKYFHFQVHRSVKILNYSILIESTSQRFCIQGSANFSPSSLQLKP